MSGELTAFLKNQTKVMDLFHDESFLPASRMVNPPDDPNVVGFYMGKKYEHVRGTEYARPVD